MKRVLYICLILIILLSSLGAANTVVDLNGDGKADVISSDCLKDKPIKDYNPNHNYEIDNYTLTVNKASISGGGENIDGYYKIVDIDNRDRYKEISVSESGPSDDLATAFYCYDGKKLIFIGKLQGSNNIKTKGDGIVVARTRSQILQTWFYDDPYRLTKNHKFKRIPKALYAMNTKVKLKMNFSLQKSPNDKRKILTLKKGETATILSSDNKQWCLVKSSKGIPGWFAVESFNMIKGTKLNANDVFDGLCNAD